MQIEMKILNKEFYTPYIDRETIMEKESCSWEEAGELQPFIIGNLPSYATSGSAAMDLICTKDITIYPQERITIPTGIAIWVGSANAVPEQRQHLVYNDIGGMTCNVAGVILPRSGLGTKGLVLANTVGLIDEDYQGELLVSGWNSNLEYGDRDTDSFLKFERNKLRSIELKAGDRFCQIMFMPVIKAQFQIVEQFSNLTERGQSGFGSTGL